ncbi:GNAT family N-acetyltransferase [Acidaminobacter sp. JC074]|uniref:GNAT family N-acetyltransferase n=1 Tax=Acidaminobacter sp. JC074 TaxID=2530199 RepID=UPI001F0F42D7|nr:GNAT family N-acetyltransferase [Acidaminobacter sp. JC074]MCH4888249.1 GNAT family N-acetyltransferase [Acidaminobacter sp. JC074]
MYKKADLKDADLILDFCLELKAQDAKMSFTSMDTLEEIVDELKSDQVNLYIAVEDDIVTAMFRAIRGEGNKSHACYIACAVKKTYRQRHLATDLTNYGLADMKSQGVLIARTKIYSWNKASIKTIEKCGFELGGRVVMHQYEPELGDYIDDLIYHKIL